MRPVTELPGIKYRLYPWLKSIQMFINRGQGDNMVGSVQCHAGPGGVSMREVSGWRQ